LPSGPFKKARYAAGVDVIPPDSVELPIVPPVLPTCEVGASNCKEVIGAADERPCPIQNIPGQRVDVHAPHSEVGDGLDRESIGADVEK
jgi:hypothetical protein